MTGGTLQAPDTIRIGSDDASTSFIDNTASSSSSWQYIDHRLMSETAEAGENAATRVRTIQIVITESWIVGIQTLWEEAKELFVDLLVSVLHLLCMKPDTLLLFSTILLILDRVVSFLSGIMENLLARTMVGPERRLMLLENIESLLRGASWGLHAASKNNDNSGRIDSYNNMEYFSSWMGWKLGYSRGDDKLGNLDNSDVVSVTTVVMAVSVAVFINTSYFTTLMAPLYSRLLDSHNLSTEVLLSLLLLLFGLETITALSFILLGYKLLSTQVAGTPLQDSSRSIFSSDTTVHDASSLSMREEANLLLVLATLLWLSCVVTSKVVRMALYNSIGD